MSIIKDDLKQSWTQLTDPQKAALLEYLVEMVMDDWEAEVVNWMVENVLDGVHPFEDMDNQAPSSLKELLSNPDETKKSGIQATVIPIDEAIEQGVLGSTLTHAHVRTGDVIEEVVMVILHDGHTLSVQDVIRGMAVQCSCGKWVRTDTTKRCPERGITICPACWKRVHGLYYSKRAALKKNMLDFWRESS
jgi:hypothetical protein